MITFKTCEKCGEQFSGEAWHIKRRKFCSHACYAKTNAADLLGKRFGRLVVTAKAEGKRWESACDCGGKAVSQTQSLLSGKAQSCGCIQRETAANQKRTHGASDTASYRVWDSMIQRCTNQKLRQWKDYGGRGITVCDSWRIFENFLADMGQPPTGGTIERRQNDLGYSKENCVWATRSEQQRNRRANRLLTHNGATKCVTEWAEDVGLSTSAITGRLRYGWTIPQALGFESRKPHKRTRVVRKDSRWIEFGGKRMYLAEWCKELGINSKTVHSRIARGASDIEALRLA